MRILISNDDGIYAPGIMALYQAVRDLGEISVVAPHAEQSAVGHAITISDPIKIKTIQREGDFEGYAVVGTPADCVKLAVSVLLDKPPDLIISGINLGPNAGISVIYSGTVSAATEGTILGIPSMAISVDAFTNPLWDTAGQVARRLAQELLQRGLPPDTLLNVNVPNRPMDQIRGFAVTRMGRSRFAEIFHRRITPRGDTYYWLDGELQMLGDLKGTDFQALAEGYVSLTPIGFDLTRHACLPELKQWNLAL
ncbi:MAG: 5'/3'-nucleotidase SurE [Verrucomicrobia bacterium]|nr:5'/3'-nucleotidase SurE [Verrucomicrobiota bacterium]MBU4248199.1 5'/3'-nucleotidase SurE [Verrucomicrobiota bacterium]MBU4429969.1 5'/3'-nucleotidase SurE [Verrucomicrobiota bacterium]MBU4497391.1 5'/3'-nucleotidase SurE [Verrucomicrobiota bacterium]